MRRHNLLLSLLALLFAVFMTACNSGTTNNAKAPIGDGGNEGGVATPTLSFSVKYLEDYRNVEFTGSFDNANVNVEDYEFIWDFGDKTPPVPGDGLNTTHYYGADGNYNVTLTASPKDPDKTPAVPVATGLVTISQTGIYIQAHRYSALSSMEYEFQAIATTTDGSSVVYTWDFGDGTVIKDTTQNAMTHRFKKYNTEFTVKVSVKKEGGNGDSLSFPDIKISTPGLTAQMTVENDPSNAALKRMSVNFYDETGALIHGYSDGTGEVNGLDNVSYKWDFENDNTVDETTNVRYTEHTYSASSGVYTVKMTATSDTFTGTVETTGEANVELTYSLPALSARFIDTYGLKIQVDVSGNGGETFSDGGTVWYEVVFPDGQSQGAEVTHNADGTASTTISKELPGYYSNYNVTVNVYENAYSDKVLATRSTTIERPSFRYVLDGPNDGGGIFTKTFTVTPERGSYTLKNATFDWDFGEGDPVRGDVNASYTYSGSGEKTVTVTISSDLLGNSGISVAKPTTTFTINADITINRMECPNAGAGQNFLQYNCRVYLSATSGAELVYNWYKDGEPVSSCAGPYCEHAFYSYNEGHTVKVDVSVKGSNSAPRSITESMTTPNVTAVLEGPTSTIHGQNNTYKAITKVSYEGAEKTITLNNPTYTFKVAENTNNQSGGSNTWDVAFSPNPTDYQGNTVNRTVSVEVTASNLTEKVTSNSITTSVRKQDATLKSFEQPVVSCTPASDINQIRQKCKMTMRTISDIGVVSGNFKDYTAKFTYNGTSRTMTFKDLPLANGVQGETEEFTIDFNWPNYGEYTTGSTPNQSYVVGGEVYKTADSANKSPAKEANINVTLDVDYTLYPQVDRYLAYTRGGSGYKFGTWSCGHNEYLGKNSVTGKPACASNESKTEQTLKLGVFANENGSLKETLTFKWKLRASHFSGAGDILIHQFTVNKGEYLNDADLSFNLAKVLRDNGDLRYTGSAYSNKHLFFLEISSDNADILAKPVTIWYDGTNKGQFRLHKISPMMETNAYNKCTVSVMAGSNIFGGPGGTFFLSEARLLFGDADRNNNIKTFMPNGGNKPWLKFSSIAYASNNTNSGWKSFTDGNIRTQDITNSDETGWYIRESSSGPGNRSEFGKAGLGAPLSGANSNMRIAFKDMLTGGEISDYYEEIPCSISFNHMK